jgi:hypothetical protein
MSRAIGGLTVRRSGNRSTVGSAPLLEQPVESGFGIVVHSLDGQEREMTVDIRWSAG